MGFGGPHAGYLAVHAKHARQLPGRLVGVSRGRRRRAGVPPGAADPRAAHPPRQGDQQHLHRAGAAGGDGRDVRQLPRRRRADRIARRVHSHAEAIAAALGDALVHDKYFDTVLARVPGRADEVIAAAKAKGINLWRVDDDHVSVACDEATTDAHVAAVLEAFGVAACRAGRRRHRHPHLGVPDPSGLHALPHRDGDDALPAHAGRQGYRLGPQHDSARLVHDEAQRRRRDGADHLAGIRASASVRPGVRQPGAASADRRPGELAGADHRLRRGFAATQRGLAGRVRRPAGDPRLPRQPRRTAPRRLPDPVQRARHQRRVGRVGRYAGGRGGLPATTATSTSTTCAPRSANTPTGCRR